MNRFLSSVAFLLLGFALALFQEGCTIQVVNDPTPNFHHIEQRVQIQTSQIDSALQAGSLDPPMAQSLADNDDMVQNLAVRYQSASQTGDLTSNQTIYLDSLLTDNAAAIDDAIQRHDQWAEAFQGGWQYDYQTNGDPMLYMGYLHHNLEEQRAAVDDDAESGQLTTTQYSQLTIRIQVIRNTEMSYYSQNGRLALSPGQAQQLNQMVDDNYRYFRFCTHGRRHGAWRGDQYGSWDAQKARYKKNPWIVDNTGNGSGSNNQGGGRYWNGRMIHKTAPQPTPTPVPVAAAPTATPVPVAAAPTAIPVHTVVIVPTATFTRVPEAIPTATPQPVLMVPTSTSTNVPPAPPPPTATPKPVVKVPTHTPPPTPRAAVPRPTATAVPTQPSGDDQGDNTGTKDDSNGDNSSDNSDKPGHRKHKNHNGENVNSDNSGQNDNSDNSGQKNRSNNGN